MYETTEAKERRDRAEGKTSRRGKQLGKRWVLKALVCLSLLSFVISFCPFAASRRSFYGLWAVCIGWSNHLFRQRAMRDSRRRCSLSNR